MATKKTASSARKGSSIKKKDNKNLLIGGLVVAVAAMGIGYAALASTLTINGTSTMEATWRIVFTDDTVTNAGDTVSEKATFSDNDTVATYEVTLKNPGESSIHNFEITNEGNVAAKVSGEPRVTIQDAGETSAAAITYSLVDCVGDEDKIAAGATLNCSVKVEWDPTKKINEASSFDPATGVVDLDEDTRTVQVEIDFVQDLNPA